MASCDAGLFIDFLLIWPSAIKPTAFLFAEKWLSRKTNTTFLNNSLTNYGYFDII
nr:MAG TPA: hypothetical protein [Caudoviricetes sp.]